MIFFNQKNHLLSFVIDGVAYKADSFGRVTPDIPDRVGPAIKALGLPLAEAPAVEEAELAPPTVLALPFEVPTLTPSPAESNKRK